MMTTKADNQRQGVVNANRPSVHVFDQNLPFAITSKRYPYLAYISSLERQHSGAIYERSRLIDRLAGWVKNMCCLFDCNGRYIH